MSDFVRYLSGRERFIGWGIEWPVPITLPPEQYQGVLLWGNDRTFYYSDGSVWIPLLELPIDTPAPRAPTTAIEQTQLRLTPFNSRTGLTQTGVRWEIASSSEFTPDTVLFTRSVDTTLLDPGDFGLNGYQITDDDGLDFGQTFWWRAVYLSGAVESRYSTPFFQTYPNRVQNPLPITPSETETNALVVTVPETAFPSDYYYVRTEWEIYTDPLLINLVDSGTVELPNGLDGRIDVIATGLVDGTLYYWRARQVWQGNTDINPSGWVTGWTDTRSFFPVPSTMVLEINTAAEPGLGLDFGVYLTEKSGETLTGEIDWGDSSTTAISGTGAYTHTYASDGVYTVRIAPVTGSLGGVGNVTFAQSNAVSQRKIQRVLAFGDNTGLSNFNYAFLNARNLTSVPKTLPVSRDIDGVVTNRVTSMFATFSNCSQLQGDLSAWDVSAVTTFEQCFQSCLAFNSDLSAWNVESADTLSSMFKGCVNFNTPLNTWGDHLQVSGVEFAAMFYDCTSFNQPLNNWASAINAASQLDRMFYNCENFNGSLAGWNPSNVATMESFFFNCQRFDQDISGWDLSGVVLATGMMRGCTRFNQDVSGWGMDSCLSMADMFRDCSAFTGIGLENWTTDVCIDFDRMFYNESYGTVTSQFNGNLTGWTFGASNISMRQMFLGCQNFTGTGLSAWTTTNVVDMGEMFRECRVFNADITGWDTSNVGSTGLGGFDGLFWNATAFNQNLASWDVSEARSFYSTFRGCTSWTVPNQSFVADWLDSTLGAGNWAENVTSIRAMFYGATQFNTDVTDWDTSNITNMGFAFSNCPSFNQDIGSWDTSACTTFDYMFSGSIGFNQDLGTWDMTAATITARMFYNCQFFNQDLSAWRLDSVLDTTHMFWNCFDFNSDVGSWFDTHVGPITRMTGMFRSCHSFNCGDPIGDASANGITNWPVGSVTAFNYTFFDCRAFNKSLNGWDTSSATVMNHMFYNCDAYNQPMDTWDTSNVTTMHVMFYASDSFNQDLSSWDVSACTTFQGMFGFCTSFNNGGAALSWNTASAVSFEAMFRGATAFRQLVGGFDTTQLVDASYMFYDNKQYADLVYDLKRWAIPKLATMEEIFNGRSDTWTMNVPEADLANLYIEWESQGLAGNLQSNVIFHAGDSVYDASAVTARDYLINTKKWLISGDRPT